MEKIANKITDFMDEEVRDLSDTDWKEVLEIVEDNIKGQLQAKYEEEEANLN